MALSENIPFPGIHVKRDFDAPLGPGRFWSSSFPARLSCPAIGVILAVLTFLAPAAGAQVPVNDCADPSNQGTLRCAKYPADPPYVQPGGPSDPDEVKTFTRVFLIDDSARCFDGTAPTLYVDPAVDGAGNSVVSSKWLFTFSGGGSCAPMDSDGDCVGVRQRLRRRLYGSRVHLITPGFTCVQRRDPASAGPGPL